jgi:hypothetical protein
MFGSHSARSSSRPVPTSAHSPDLSQPLYSLKPEPFRQRAGTWHNTATYGKHASTDWERRSKRNAKNRKAFNRS